MSNRGDSFAAAIGDDGFDATIGTGAVESEFRPQARKPEVTGLKRIKGAVVLELSKLEPDPEQPRKNFSDEELDQLAESFKDEGQLQPVRVLPHPDRANKQGHFIILMGERRFRAAQRAGLESLEAIIEKKRLSVEDKRKIQYLENALRQDFNPIEEALFFEEQIESRKCSARELARLLHIPPNKITRARTILKLPEPIQDKVVSGELPPIVAYELGRLEDTEQQTEMFTAYLEGGLTATDIADSNPKSSKSKGNRKGGSSSSNASRTKKFSQAGLSVSATLKRAHTNTHLIETLEAWLDKLKSDGRSQKQAA